MAADFTIERTPYRDRMPPLPHESLNEKQRLVANELAQGPRGGVKGPFVALLRSPDLVDRVGKLGEYLRFGSSLAPRISEFVMLIVSREWTNQFEWAVHAPLAERQGVDRQVVRALAEGRRPDGMAADEAVAYALCDEISRTKGVSESTYQAAVAAFGENGFIDILAVWGYFCMVCAIMNAAHTPPPPGADVSRLTPFPL